MTWKGTGFSDHKVPSLSNTATRSAAGTKSGPPCRVTRSTKSRMALREALSFHEGRGSGCSAAASTALGGTGVGLQAAANKDASTCTNKNVRFMAATPCAPYLPSWWQGGTLRPLTPTRQEYPTVAN